jgi:glyoxylase-like metal-dependent hydrolase (beta-lactamase superfamily II)
VWHWEAPHPDWTQGSDWGEIVSSYAVDDGDRLLLFDPLGLPGQLEALAADRDTAIVLTCTWHARDTYDIAGRLGVPVHVPPPGSEPGPVPGQVYSAGGGLPVGVEAFEGFEPNDLVLWVESRRAVVSGDTLVDRGQGLEIPASWLREGVTREQIAEQLRPLLEKPVEIVLATHGGPTDRAALERALA